jgi:hypothetical protein
MPVVVAKPQAKAAESLTAMAFALSGVRQQQHSERDRSKDSTKSGFLSRILGSVNENTEVRVE